MACSIIPPHMLEHMALSQDPKIRHLAERSLHLLQSGQWFRGHRHAIGGIAPLVTVPAGAMRRSVYDAAHLERLPGVLVRSEGSPPSTDVEVNEAYDGAGATYRLYSDAFGRNSIDNKGMQLISTVHYGQKYDNAFWDGRQMVYGDGDGELFNRFTISVDVIGHELTHGVTQFVANLAYQDQAGALNESISDVFGSMVKQMALGQTADQADWLIGAGLFTSRVKGVALRSMKAPGTAYDDPQLGRDPQPADMSGYVTTTDDNGGVHINSGIPNRAFYLVAAALGGNSWTRAGKIWYTSLQRLPGTATFADAARITAATAAELFGSNGEEVAAVRQAWTTVGVS